MILDSVNSPLRIASVESASGGAIGMTICPGKHQKSAISGEWRRDLEVDIRAIRDWGASAVVTLMEPDELKEVKVGKLGAAVEKAGMDWHLLPIQDGGAPDEHFEDLWVYSGHALRARLGAGGKVLVHCKGGLGRTGTIAARILVELGENPQRAIERVRATRRDAIETGVQERHVLESRPPRVESTALDRILGCILGGAVGDAFGYAVEFDRWPEIERRFGSAGITEPVARNGRIIVSDDTQMTLFTMEALGDSGDAIARRDVDAAVERIRRAYLDWLDTQEGRVTEWNTAGAIAREPVLRNRRAPGSTCLSALYAGGGGHHRAADQQQQGMRRGDAGRSDRPDGRAEPGSDRRDRRARRQESARRTGRE